MIVVTGAAGFIGSCLVQFLNEHNLKDSILVDDFQREAKKKNLINKTNLGWIPRDEFFDYIRPMSKDVDFVFHLGARTDTTEMDEDLLNRLNLDYSKQVWQWCRDNSIPLVYASSAATYGGGENGFRDEHEIIPNLKPLNPYGRSKNDFDQWVLSQNGAPPFWAGLKFFNVFGPNEYHKGRMASVVFHAYKQINQTGEMKLFRSHHPDFKDGEQTRDFIYVKDLLQVLWFMYSKRPASGIYNVGTGKARTFNALVNAIFSSLNKAPKIGFIDTPEDIRDKYQYFTQAEMGKLKSAGYDKAFSTLEDSVADYVKSYLVPGNRTY